ncbi:hypothetical protein ASF49_12695 [Methylobacterium sp. Leaf104]|nr:hypothetical protein ASF49_12695 [Methylobacterium sp. Leaf104]
MEVALIPAIDRLRERAGAFLFTGHDPSPGRAASQFCTDCVEADDQLLISRLVARDGRILRLIDSSILAGSAFEGQPLSEPDLDDTAVAILDESLDEPPEEGIPPLPESISRRIHNLATLAPDLRAATGDVEGL